MKVFIKFLENVYFLTNTIYPSLDLFGSWHPADSFHGQIFMTFRCYLSLLPYNLPRALLQPANFF